MNTEEMLFFSKYYRPLNDVTRESVRNQLQQVALGTIEMFDDKGQLAAAVPINGCETENSDYREREEVSLAVRKQALELLLKMDE